VSSILSNFLCRILKSAAALAVIASTLLAVCAVAQNNPVPQIVGPVHPMAVAPGGGDFTLSVYGANFVPGAVVNWNYQQHATTYVSGHELQAQILSTDIAKNTAGYISVTNPAPGGGSSSASWAQVEVHDPMSIVTFNSPNYYFFGFWNLVVADFNHDAVLDVVGELGHDLALELGTGTGTIKPQSIVGRFQYPSTQVGYGDFTGNGNLDVVYVPGPSGYSLYVDQIAVMLGDGKGNFTKGPTTTSESGFQMLSVGDFNRDGKLDVVSVGHFLTTFLGNGDGTFTQGKNYPYETIALQWVAGDFNGDGILDLMLFTVNPLSIRFLEGNGDGTFKKPKLIASFSNERGCTGAALQDELQVSDFNGDGKLDFAFCDSSQVGIFLGNGDGTFQKPNFYTADSTGMGHFSYALGDINSDGKPDLLISEYSNYKAPQFVLLLGNGDGTFQAPSTTNVNLIATPEEGITVGDFNSDGLLDVVFQTGLGDYVFVQQ
jgi:hypothetical protein